MTRTMTLDEVAYYSHCILVEEAWHRHNAAVDSWIDTGNYEALRESQEACEQMDAKQHELYKRAYCKHEHLMDFESACPDCGKIFDQSFI